jgi:hypothetical protein
MSNDEISEMNIIHEVRSIQTLIVGKHNAGSLSSSQVVDRLDALKRYRQDLETALENMRSQGI